MPAHAARSDAELIRSAVDTLIPAVEANADDEPSVASFKRLAASDLGIDAILLEVLPTMAPHVAEAIDSALIALGDDFTTLDQSQREARWLSVEGDRTTRFGALALRSTACAMFYTVPDDQLSNPTWEAIGYKGPLLPPPSPEERPKRLTHLTDPDAQLEADVVVIGSGAGGGVAAARLAAAGLRVIVVERGHYRNEPDLPQLEALALPNLYLEGGFIWTDEGSAALLAGSTVGGGTTVNSMACLPTPRHVRNEWGDRGMEGVFGEEFDRHINAVMARINAVPENSTHDTVNTLMMQGWDALGRSHEVLARNARDADDRFCGECKSGCLVGCKQSTMITFLEDASDDGAVLIAGCRVETIETDGRKASGVSATFTATDGSNRRLHVQAPQVVLAAGAIASPMILQASGLGGPAVGQNLHIHPSFLMSGVFDEEVRGWEGHILTSVCHDFDRINQDHGFLVEAAPMSIGLWTGLTGWRSGEQHKSDQLRLRYVSSVWGFLRDHAGGSVERGPDGRALTRWDLEHPIDTSIAQACHVELARILKASGAKEIFTFLPNDPRWREGEDFDAFLELLGSLAPDDIFSLSAHQTGSCATGSDPETSVVDGRGQVHGIAGLFVADASALPTAPGVNPMVSIEAYAHRTAEYVAEAAGVSIPVQTRPVPGRG